jgi:Flp pilus assembly protein TadD
MTRLQPVAFAMLVALLLVGCATFRGARLYQSGTVALDRGDPQVAIVQLERAARLVPEASEVQNHLGLAYAADGRDEDALRAFRRAVDLNCDNEVASHNLWLAERRVGGQRGTR